MSNWYSRYYGDYMRDTSHLSLVEHGAYTVLLDHYYSTRTPIKNSADVLYRICRAFDDIERAAVNSVVAQFFKDDNGFLRNNRADRELAKEEAVSKARAIAGLKGSHIKHNAIVKQLPSNCQAIAKQLPDVCCGKEGGKPLAAATTTTTTTTNTATAIPTEEYIHPPAPKGELFPVEELPEEPKAEKPWEPNLTMLEIGSWFGRKPTTRWTKKELKALKDISTDMGTPPEYHVVEAFYTANITTDRVTIDNRRHDVATLLNNWNGEIDKARKFILARRRVEPTFAMQVAL